MHTTSRRQPRSPRRPKPSILTTLSAIATAAGLAVMAAPVEARTSAFSSSSSSGAANRTVSRTIASWTATTSRPLVKRSQGRALQVTPTRNGRSFAVVSRPVAAPFAGPSRASVQLRSAQPNTRVCVGVERGRRAGTIARTCLTVGRAWHNASVGVSRLAHGQRVRLSVTATAARPTRMLQLRNARLVFNPSKRIERPKPAPPVAPSSTTPGTTTPGTTAPGATTPGTTTPGTTTPAPAPQPTTPVPPTPAPRQTSVTCDRIAAPNGSDSSSGTLAAPFQTAQKLASSLSAGQTGCLRAGTYSSSGQYVLDLSTGGLHISSYPGERAKLFGVVHVRSGASSTKLSALAFEGNGTMNTIKIYAPDVVVEDSDITNVGRGPSCLMLGNNSGAGQATRVVVRRNRFHDCGSTTNGNKDHAIYAENVTSGQIVGNVFWNSAAYAIQLYPNAQGTLFAHNVIDGDSPSIRGGIVFGGDTSYASSNNLVEYNVVAYAASANIISNWSGAVGTGNVARNNCVWAGSDGNVDTSGGGFSASDNLAVDPRFLDRSKRDYRLASGSACLKVVGYDAAALLK